MTHAQTLLTMQGITKRFPGVQALSQVDFTVHHGEIHALMGENGAGKSTLIKVLTGVEKADSGSIHINGQPIQVSSPLQAQTLGISTVYQEVNLCTNLSVAENIFIGREPRKWGRLDWRTLKRDAARILAQMDIEVDVSQSLGMYPVAIQQMVAIARALQIKAKLLILDEPTSSLDAYETTKLFQLMRRLRDDGLGIIFITHFLDQVYEISDRITILRNGHLVSVHETVALPRFELVAKMIGRNLTDLAALSSDNVEGQQARQGEPLLVAQGLARTGTLQPFDLTLHAGEVVGFAGLLGSGRTETANLLFGADKPNQGTFRYDNQPVSRFSPLDSIHRGIALCPEDRKADGIVPDLTVRENIILALQASRGWFNLLSRKEQRQIADKYINLLKISTPHAEQAVKNLSGGNQQKVIVARWLAINPRLLILDEPTRGIDIGTKAEIQKMVLELAAEGKACVFISSELEEVLRTSQRVVVWRDRQKVAELSGDALSQTTIMEAIAGR